LEGKAPHQRVVIDLSISPNAKRTEVVGWHDGALRLRLAAPPVDGAANEALRRWLADEIGLPMARVELIRGASGRRKQCALDADMHLIETWLSKLCQSRRFLTIGHQ
jgi:uncharacterized protein (TIGR00251 family)